MTKDFERIDRLEKDMEYIMQILTGHLKRQEKLLEFYADMMGYFRDILELKKNDP